MKRTDEAVPLFEQGLEQIRFLCGVNPRNRGYWVTSRYLHEEIVKALQAANHEGDAKRAVHQAVRWFQTTALTVPRETAPQAQLAETRLHLERILRAMNLEGDAEELSQSNGQLHTNGDGTSGK
jgi:hypothetical protein